MHLSRLRETSPGEARRVRVRHSVRGTLTRRFAPTSPASRARCKKKDMAYLVEGSTGAWEVVVGMEVHAQVISRAKLFSGAATDFGAPPNTQVSFVDAAFPGMLPVINRECVAQAVRTGLGLNAHINVVSRFDRKNYFYADLPAGYQISQYQHPIVGEGRIEIELADGSTREIGITRLHLEQDAGKSLHDQHPTRTYVDLNRSGVALMEIVSEPDIRSPEEAGAYLRKLRSILRYLGTCDGNMEEGSMRADVNVSVRKHDEPYRTRCEVKNVNSIRFVMQAIEAEAKRQVEVWESGSAVEQETRLFDSGRGTTRSMRSKEDAHDYRYFPDPDLLPLVLDEAWVAELKTQLPELPDAKKRRFMDDYGLTAYDAGVLVAEQATADFYEVVAKDRDAKIAANWVTGDLFAALNRAGCTIADSPVSAASLGRLLDLLADGTVSGRIAKDVFEAMVQTGKDPAEIVEEKGLRQVTDTGAIDTAVAQVLAANADKVAEYKAGREKLFGFFVGQVMKAMAGKGNPALVNETLKRALSSS
jgi:aspartyl-tRNA(Asn)/glutamyl-tRNA(Gln) amidotransferase subunit B